MMKRASIVILEDALSRLRDDHSYQLKIIESMTADLAKCNAELSVIEARIQDIEAFLGESETRGRSHND